MKKLQQIQFGFLGLVALLFVFNLTSCASDSADAKDEARQTLETNAVSVNNPNTPAAPVTTKPNEPAAPVGPTTVMSFNENEFDFGVVDAGEKVKHIYKFKNSGNEPLIISNAKGSCGCTVPSWPKEPIPVGSTGEIEVVFDSKGKKGKQSKRVTITANTDPVQTFLTIKGEVTPAAGDAAAKPQPIKPQSPAQ